MFHLALRPCGDLAKRRFKVVGPEVAREESDDGHDDDTNGNACCAGLSVPVNSVLLVLGWLFEWERFERLASEDNPCEHGTHDGAVEQVNRETELAEPAKCFDRESAAQMRADENREAQ